MSASGIARFFPEKLFNFVQCVLCNLADIPPFLPRRHTKKLLAIFSGNYKQDYQNTRTGTESFDLYLRLLMVTDYISGMTDSYARTLYRELSGIE